MRVGEIVLKRSIYRGNVRWTFPHRYVGEWNGRIGIYCGPGNQGKAMRRGPGGYLKRWMSDAPPFIDTTDWALDLTVQPDGTWVWKDEDELAEAVELGIFDEAAASRVREEGERVLAAAPWPTGWEEWRPPSGWGPLGLPRDWHVV